MTRYQTQQLDVPLIRGISQQTDERMQSIGALQTVDNLYYEKEARLVPRPGLISTTITKHGGGSLSGTTKRVAPRGNGLVLATSERLYERATDLGTYYDAGPVPEIAAPDRQVIARDVTKNHSYGCMTIVGGYRVYAWVLEDSPLQRTGELWAAVYSSDGRLIFREFIDDVSQKPMLIQFGTDAVLFWLSTTAPFECNYAILDCSSTPSGWGSATTLFTDVSSDAQYDVDTDGTNHIVVGWYDTSGDIGLRRINAAYGVSHSVTLASHDASSALGIHTDGTYVMVGYSNSTGPTTEVVFRLAADLTSVLATTQLINTESDSISFVATQALGPYFWVAGQSATVSPFGQAFNRTHTGTVTRTGTVAASSDSFWHFKPASRVWRYNSRNYVVQCHVSNTQELQSAFYVTELFSDPTEPEWPRVAAVITAGGQAQSDAHQLDHEQLSSVVSSVAGEYEWAAPERFRFGGEDLGEAGLTKWSFSYVDEKSPQTAELGGALYLSGGVLSQYDGEVVHEVGFTHGPHKVWMDTTVTAGSATWQYTATYIWQDGTGRLHEGPPSQPLEVTSAGTPVTVRVQTLGMTSKYRPFATPQGTPVAVRIYRTLDASTTFYHVGDVINEPGSAYVSFTDSVSDGSLSDNTPLYIDGGGIPNDQPLAARVVGTWDSRVFAGVEGSARFSKQIQPDRAAEFVASSTHQVDVDADSYLELIAEMDGALVLGSEKRVTVQQGTGPGANGAPLYPAPRQIAMDEGCADWRGTQLTPVGLIYFGSRGFKLLPRGFGAVQWLSESARDEIDTEPEVLGSALLLDRNIIVFGAKNNDDSKLLFFDYQRGRWSTGTLPASFGALTSVAAVGGSLFLTHATNTNMWSESGVGDQGSTQVVAEIETTKLRPSDKVSGYSRVPHVRVVASMLGTSAVLTLEVAYDDGAYEAAESWQLSGAAGDLVQLEHALAYPQCGSLQMRWRTAITPGSGGGEGTPNGGLAFHALSLDVAAKRQRRPLHEAARR